MITVKRGTSADMQMLWDGRFADFAARYAALIDSGEQEIWMAWDDAVENWIGELHILWKHEDNDFADGIETAYLLAFRVNSAQQRKGTGKQLMQRVLERIAERGFSYATIGVEEHDEMVFSMYRRWGFTQKIKESSFIYDEGGTPKVSTFSLYRKQLKNHMER